MPGDRLLDFLKEIYGDTDPEDYEGSLFWLVTADQFERRGFKCQKSTAAALTNMEDSSALRHARALPRTPGMTAPGTASDSANSPGRRPHLCSDSRGLVHEAILEMNRPAIS